MKTYTSSQPLTLESAAFRERCFTSWLPLEGLQAAIDFNLTLGLLPIYVEHRDSKTGRYLFWHPPDGMEFEVRSGRSENLFREFDEKASDRGVALLSLHINEDRLYSAVWVAEEHLDSATTSLNGFGLSRATRS